MKSYNVVIIFLYHIFLGAYYRLKWFFSWTVTCNGEFNRNYMQQVINGVH